MINVLVPAMPGEDGMAYGPVVILHTREDAAVSSDNPGHVFGPFSSVAEAIEFTEEVGEDDEPEHEDHCIKTIIPLRIAVPIIGHRIIAIRFPGGEPEPEPQPGLPN